MLKHRTIFQNWSNSFITYLISSFKIWNVGLTQSALILENPMRFLIIWKRRSRVFGSKLSTSNSEDMKKLSFFGHILLGETEGCRGGTENLNYIILLSSFQLFLIGICELLLLLWTAYPWNKRDKINIKSGSASRKLKFWRSWTFLTEFLLFGQAHCLIYFNIFCLFMRLISFISPSCWKKRVIELHPKNQFFCNISFQVHIA